MKLLSTESGLQAKPTIAATATIKNLLIFIKVK